EQANVPAANRQIGIDRRGARPDARARGPIDLQLRAQACDDGHVTRGDDQTIAQAFRSHRTPPRAAKTSRRRARSMSQPPARNSTPSTIKLADRPSLSMTCEK